jgi:hypothetical protein
VKAVRPDLADNPEFRSRFEREVAAAKHVSGQYTALVVDADVAGPVPWLATSYIAGPSLAEGVLEHGPLPVAAVLTLAAGLAEGLRATHAAGVIHRDLKPGNVLLSEDGPRLIDFGISRAAEASSLTQTGLIVGSPGFLSPEQAEGHEIGPFSDVFSLGAVIAFAASGEGPFGTGTSAALLYRVVHSRPFLGRLPEEIRPLVEQCLQKDPALRPTTADLLAELGPAWSAQDVVGWLPMPIAGALSRYQPPGPVASEALTDPGLPAVPDLVPMPLVVPQPRGAHKRPRSRRQDLAWLGVTSGLAAAAVAVIVLPGASGGTLAVVPPAQTGTSQPSPYLPVPQVQMPGQKRAGSRGLQSAPLLPGMNAARPGGVPAVLGASKQSQGGSTGRGRGSGSSHPGSPSGTPTTPVSTPPTTPVTTPPTSTDPGTPDPPSSSPPAASDMPNPAPDDPSSPASGSVVGSVLRLL